MTFTATGDPSYDLPLRPRITIKTIDGEDTLYTFDAFEDTNDITIPSGNMENSIGETGTFGFTINDHNNEIGKDNLHDVKVFMELGKTNTSFQHFLIGFGELFEVDRPGTNEQFYNLSGFGTKIWAYQLYINRRETYRRTESDAKVYNIINNALTKRLWRPLKTLDESIEDITGWSPDGISTKVNTPFTVIDKSFVYFGDLCDELCDVTGAVWFIDYSTGSEIFTFTYNPDLETNVLIKSGDLKDTNNDDALKTAYIEGAFRIGDDTSTQAGTATRLFTTTIQDSQNVFEIGPTAGQTSLDFRALAQQVVIDNDARRIEQIELSLSKTGDPQSPNNRVNGDIVLDNNNKPTGNILDEFHIDLGSIKHNPEKIKVDVDISPSKLDVAQSKIWVRLFQRSGDGTINNGEPQHDPNNTVFWHHNNIFNTTQAYYSASANEGDENKKDTLSWNATNQGPMYRITIYSNLRRLFSRTNKKAANLIRLREQFINTDFLLDPTDVTRYLSLNLSKTSKGRRAIGDFLVTVPNNYLFRPYQWVGFSDGLSNISDTVQVQRVSYNISASGTDDSPLGTLYASLTLSSSYNPLVGSCSCI